MISQILKCASVGTQIINSIINSKGRLFVPGLILDIVKMDLIDWLEITAACSAISTWIYNGFGTVWSGLV